MVFGFGMGALGILMGIIGGIIGLLAGGIGLTVGGVMLLIPHPGVSAAFSSYSSCLCGRGAYDDGSWYPAAPGFHLAGLPGVPGSIPLGGGSDPESPAQRYTGR